MHTRKPENTMRKDPAIASTENKQQKKHTLLFKQRFSAIWFSILLFAVPGLLLFLSGCSTTDSNAANQKYNDFTLSIEETAILWPWEFLTPAEKYTSLEFNGSSYYGRGCTVSDSYPGESLGVFSVFGYDPTNDKKYSAEFKVYPLQNIDQTQFLVVEIDDAYYVFKSDEYAPPKTWGDLLQSVDLPKLLQLDHFSENGDGPTDKHFLLDDDTYIWERLADCTDAAFLEDDMWMAQEREYLSFSVTSEPLGVYKRALYITADGYLWTNLFDWAYIFEIGEDAASDIIAYVKKNAEKAEFEPYQKTIAGQMTEITEAYIFLDDSILCKDPAEGATYRIPLDDIRISRYTDNRIIKTGDIIQVAYRGEIDTAQGNLICNAVSIDRAHIYNGDLGIPE